MKIGRSVSTLIAAHNVRKTGVHGVDTLYVARSSRSDQLIANATVAPGAAIGITKLDPLVCSEAEAAALIAAIPLVISGLEADIPAPDTFAEGTVYIHMDKDYISTITGGAWVKSFSEVYFDYPDADIAHFTAIPAAGDFSANPEYVNDNNTATTGSADTINQYAEIDFGHPVKINQWRQWGAPGQLGTGEWALYYRDVNGALQSWVSGIPTRADLSWTSYSVETEHITRYVRIKVSIRDTSGLSALRELDITHS